MMRQWMRIAAVGVVCVASLADAAEYFVSTQGSDRADGLSVGRALRTIQKGVSALKAGDTLTILPGEYRESVTARLTGEKGKPILIRAQRPGTALLRGDVGLGGFGKLPGAHYTYYLDTDTDFPSVTECDTGQVYALVPSAAEVEDIRCSRFYDPKAKRLYIHTSDSADPARHALVGCVAAGDGLRLEPPKGRKTIGFVTVEGLTLCGFMHSPGKTNRRDRRRNVLCGVRLTNAESCRIRNCVVFRNGGGLVLSHVRGCVIEGCRAFANYSALNSSRGNIIVTGQTSDTVVRDCVAHSSKSNNFRFYSGTFTNCSFEGNLSYECGGTKLGFKGKAARGCRMLRNRVRGAIFNMTRSLDTSGIRRNLCTYLNSHTGSTQLPASQGNIVTSTIKDFSWERNFADPVRHDYRLQSDSPLRGKGPRGSDLGPLPYRGDVFFVKPNGDDNASGTCVRKAWKSLRKAAADARPGHTVYVLGGTYRETLAPTRSGAPDRLIRLVARGRKRVVLDGGGEISVGVDLTGRSHIELQGLTVTRFRGPGLRASKGASVEIAECVFLANTGDGVAASEVRGLDVGRCLFRGSGKAGLRLRGCADAEITGTLFDNDGQACLNMDRASAAGLWMYRNAFAASARPWALLAGKAIAGVDSLSKALGRETYSVVARPDYVNPGAGDFRIGPKSNLAGRGPLDRCVGPYSRVERPTLIEGAEVHSVTSTTANLECRTPASEQTPLVFRWGETEACKNTIKIGATQSVFRTVSLCGLKPGRQYYFRFVAPLPSGKAGAPPQAQSGLLRFRTLDKDPPRRTLHVSSSGDDKNDGLSPERAFRTIRHAAGLVRAGDTVIIHRGDYPECVWVRATGDAHAPIVFRGAPREQAWMRASLAKRSGAFRIIYKNYILLDGLYFGGFRHKQYQSDRGSQAVFVLGGGNITVSRCFSDPRPQPRKPWGTAPFFRAWESHDVLVENCVTIAGWASMSFFWVPNTTVRNCVIYHPFVGGIGFLFRGRQPVNLNHNIITDCSIRKCRNKNSLLYFVDLESHNVTSDYNCYFMRRPEDVRTVIGVRNIKGRKTRTKYLLKDFRRLTGQGKHSFFGNPGMRVVKELKYWERGQKGPAVSELRTGGVTHPLDFDDFSLVEEPRR